jgi:SAM-dependent methyltransferase
MRHFALMTSEPRISNPLPYIVGKPVAHNGAKVEGDGPITIATTPDQWAFAAAFRYEAVPATGLERIIIRIDLTIHRGRIGAIFVTDALTEALGGDQERSVIDSDTSVEVIVDNPPPSGWLVIRNNAPGRVTSECSVHRINVYSQLAPNVTKPQSLKLSSGGHESVGQVSEDILDALRQKWCEVPLGLMGRRRTADLLKLDDLRLKELWMQARDEATTGDGYSVRGWYQDLYRDILRGKQVLDVGAGLGFDGITFARAGADVTFLDIVQSNLEVLSRLCKLFKVKTAKFFHLEDLNGLSALPGPFDVIWCLGSMINAPFEFSRLEARALLNHLRIGGRWIELAYPRERWQRDGSPPFELWGKFTDGASTPWMEWYDLPRLLDRLEPALFDVLLSFNFHNNDFNWFDLIRRK